MKLKNSIPLVAVLFLAAGNFAPTARAATEKILETFSLNADGRVRLENVNGRIEVHSWDGPGVKLEAVKEGRTAEIVAGIKIKTESTPDRLAIKTELPKVNRGWFRGTSHEGQVDYILLVPAGANLEKLESVNGDVNVDGIHGTVNVSTVNGRIKCRDLAGTLEAGTVNGGIETEHTALKPGDRLEASSVNGSIAIRLPRGVAATLDASSVNGSIRSDFAFTTSTKNSKHSIEARIAGGGAGIRLSTVNGGIRVRELTNEQASAR